MLGSERWRHFGTDVQKLYNNRYRITRRFQVPSDEELYGANAPTQTFQDFGELDGEAWGVSPADSKDGVAYTNARLIEQRTEFPPGLGYQILVYIYETITDEFVETQEPRKSVGSNGLGRLDIEQVGSPSASFTGVVGTTEKEIDGVTYYLAQVQEQISDEAQVRLNTVWLEAGELSRSEDNVGSQKAIVISSFIDVPATPATYTLARTQVRDIDGVPTNEYTFLKPSVLSESKDNVGSQEAITIQAFNQTPTAPSGYSLAQEQVSDFEGIPTRSFTFLKDNVELSRSEDKVGSQLAIVVEQFNGTPTAPAGYSVANEQRSNFEGIPTRRFTFLKNDVELSRSEDKVGSQLSIVIEQFNGTPTTPAGYSIANEQRSNFDGIPTRRFTFLKNDVLLSESEDKVGSQNAITEQWFKPEQGRDAKDGYSLARTQASDVEGIPTESYTFLEDDVELQRTEEYVGSQLSISVQIFNPAEDPAIDDYVLARKEESDVEGIPTTRFTFLKENVELSRSEDYVGSQLSITTQVFKPDDDPTEDDYVLARKESSDVEGIPTTRYTFLKEDVKLSESEDLLGSQKAITEQWFKPNAGRDTKANYSLVREQVSDVDGIPTKDYTFLKNDVLLSESKDFVGSQLAITQEWFNPSAPKTIAGYELARTDENNVEGIETVRYTFLKPGRLSDTRNGAGPVPDTRTITISYFKTDSGTPIDGVQIARQERDLEGIPVITETYVAGNITGVKSQWSERIDVPVPGIITFENVNVSLGSGNGQLSGDVPTVRDTPPRTKSVIATVKVEIVDEEPGAFTPAFDLSNISCSVTRTQISAVSNTPTVLVKGNQSFIGERVNGNISANTTAYPKRYFSGSSPLGSTIEFITGWYDAAPASPTVLDPTSNTSRVRVELIATGATSLTGYNETGIIQRKVREVFSSLNQQQRFYEVITWEV